MRRRRVGWVVLVMACVGAMQAIGSVARSRETVDVVILIEEIDGCADVPPVEVILESPAGRRYVADTGSFVAVGEDEGRTIRGATVLIRDVELEEDESVFRLSTSAANWSLLPHSIEVGLSGYAPEGGQVHFDALLVHRRVFVGRVTDAATGAPIVARLGSGDLPAPRPLAQLPERDDRISPDGDPRRVDEDSTVTTDEDGRFEYSHPYTVGPIRVWAVGYQPLSWTPPPDAGSTRDAEVHDFALLRDPRRAELHVVATDEAGAPAAGAALTVVCERTSPWRVDLVDPSTDVPWMIREMFTHLQPVEGLEVDGSPAPKVLNSFREMSGSPSPPSELDSAGTAGIRVTRPGRFLVRVTRGEFVASARVDVAPGESRRVELALARGVGLDVKVTFRNGRDPVWPRCDFLIEGEWRRRSAIVDASDLIQVRGLPPGATLVFCEPYVTDPSLAEKPVPARIAAPVEPGTIGAAAVTFVAAPASERATPAPAHDADHGTAVVQGRIVCGAAAWPVPIAGVELYQSWPSPSPWLGQVRRDGTFRIEDVPAGRFALMAFSIDLAAQSEIDVVDGEAHEVEIRLLPVATVPVKVVDRATGLVVEGVVVSRACTPCMDPNLRHVLVPAGTVTPVEVSAPGYASKTIDLDARTELPDEVKVELDRER